jgi:hypothetical protein
MTGAACASAVFATALVLVTGMPWGVTSAFAYLGRQVLELIESMPIHGKSLTAHLQV